MMRDDRHSEIAADEDGDRAPIADQGELLPVLDGSQNSRAKAKGPEDPRGLSLPASTAHCRPAL
jgi:hypothetical protein